MNGAQRELRFRCCERKNVRTTFFRNLLGTALTLLIAFAACGADRNVSRIVSMNLCTDSMLFELVSADRIVSVTYLSRDPNLSFFHAQAAKLHTSRGHVEEIISFDPELVVTDSTTLPFARRLLENLGIRVMTFEHANNSYEYRTNLRRLAAAVGAAERANAIIEQIESDHATPIESTPVRALLYQPNGFAPGTATLMSDIMTRAGYANVAGELGFEFGGFIALESILTLAPAAVIFSARESVQPSLAEAQLSHPALRRYLYEAPDAVRPVHVSVPEHLWTCAGSFNQRAIDLLRRARR